MTPKAIVDALELRLGVSGVPRQLRDAIELELLATGAATAHAAEESDRLRRKVELEIVRRRDSRDEAGEISILHLRGVHNDIVYGSSFIFADDTASIQTSKANRLFVDSIYQKIRSLSFGEFERFGACVLKELGCSFAKVTPHAGDQGIDFYGKLSVGELVGADPAILRLLHETQFLLVGQAKHYPTISIGPSVVRELIGAMSLSRTHTFSKAEIDLLDDVRLRPFSPVMALLFSTGDFTKGARFLAERAGIIALSGWQLAVFLADKGIGIDGTNSGFAPQLFDAWLAQTLDDVSIESDV